MAKRILVIDDDEDILTILDIIFKEEGYETILYQTGVSTAQIKVLHPDLILLDVRINGFEKTGTEICLDIKNELELKKVPVLLLSAEFDVAALALNSGANGYMNKPFDVNKLLTKVKEFLT
ncbi:response regulator transcription factor [Pedobacter frigiditerrae]|uniref:response regulator transcription factor n=1 Tax=Pedobacter frigiditerrae TaxID=2530452 RepID=UPI0029318E86|nr:response regulator [Pedobacter frigiditerrae]